MSQYRSVRIQDHFPPSTDPRRREVVYPLINIVSIAICAVIAGADDFVSIAEYGCKKRKWLGQFLDLMPASRLTIVSTPSSARSCLPNSSGAC